jgi:uncharacterized protein YqgV (UPF0045/DUF77 family)
MFLSAQLSLYPLRQPLLSQAIGAALGILKEHGLEVIPGTMSSVATGDDDDLFAAIKEIFRKGAEQGDLVMVVALSNACPVT